MDRRNIIIPFKMRIFAPYLIIKYLKFRTRGAWKERNYYT